MWWLPAIIVVAVIAGIASDHFLGNDNAIEQAAETVIEHELHLPDGSVDLSPNSKDINSVD